MAEVQPAFAQRPAIGYVLPDLGSFEQFFGLSPTQEGVTWTGGRASARGFGSAQGRAPEAGLSQE